MEMPACVVSVLFKELLVIDYVALENIVIYYLTLLWPSDILKNVLKCSNTIFDCRGLAWNTLDHAARSISIAFSVAQDIS